MNKLMYSLVFGVLASGIGVPVLATQPDDRYLWPEGGMVYTESTITPWKARTLAHQHHVLTLLKVSEVSVDVAKSLVIPYEDTFLTCPAVKRLDAKAAEALAKRPGYLRLWGLTVLTPEVGSALVRHKGQTVELTGVREITPAVAAAISGGKRYGIELGLTSISVDVASALAKFQGEIFLPDLESLTVEAATAFRTHKSHLDLGKAKITAEVAEILLLHEGEIGMIGVKRLEPGVGDILARHKAEVYLQLEEIDSVPLARKMFKASNASSSVHDLRTMSPEIAAEYAREDPGSLEHLDLLSPEAARELARCEYDIDLPGLIRLTPELAKALTDRKPAVYLTGIKSLEGVDGLRVAEVLASTPAPVYLEFLERVSPAVLAALRKKSTIKLPPDEELTIIPESN
jgi:hypothetical protein